MLKGCPYGTHRVIQPKGVLPQPALKINNDMNLHSNEILIDVRTLNIDSASFTQIREEAGDNIEEIKNIMQRTVDERGKHQNPVTGSGGMLIGTVERIGKDLVDKVDLKVGDKIATLVSLSLTPLRIDEFLDIRKDVDQVDIRGKAILFESGIYARIPNDMPENLALSVLDVAGAAAQVAKLVKPGDTVVVLGGTGKSGMLCLYEARKRAGVTGSVICVGSRDITINRVKEAKLADHYIKANATDAVELLERVKEVTNGEMADIVINAVNIANTEMSTILLAKDRGIVYFFSMATNFAKAALGAEGIGKDVTMIVGNGYTKDHAEISLNLMRESEELRRIFTDLYA